MNSLRSDSEILHSIEQSPQIGGGYYNPPEEIEDVGRRLKSKRVQDLCDGSGAAVDEPSSFFTESLFRELSSLLEADELLFGLYARTSFRLAAYINSEERLLDFELQVSQGTLQRVGFFGLNVQAANTGMIRDFR